MKIKMLRRARQLYNSPYVPPQVNRANQLKWIRAIRLLGPKWPYWELQPLVRVRRQS